MEDERHDILSKEDFETLRRDNPQALFRHLSDLRREFVFGVEDRRDEDGEGWGGEVRLVLNRNLTLHLVPHWNDDMTVPHELPQFTVFPSAERADQVERTAIDVDGERIEGAVFYVDPDEFDTYRREALEVVGEYGDWGAIPDSYYLHLGLVKFINRVVLEDSVVRGEREFDFRLGLVGGAEPPPLDDEEQWSPEDMVGSTDPDAPPEYRSHPVEWGGD